MERQVKPADTYADRVKKLIPAEVSAAFLAINASIPAEDTKLIFAYGFFIALVPICVAYLRILEDVRSWPQIVFTSFIAFPIWALNIAVYRLEWMHNKLFLSSGLLVLVTLVLPLVTKGVGTNAANKVVPKD